MKGQHVCSATVGFRFRAAANPNSATPDLATILEPYENKWVTLSPDYTHVVASGETLKDVYAKVPEGDRAKVVFHNVLPFDTLYIPSTR